MMNYKGYAAHVVYDDEARIFHGEVVDTRDVITFEGTNVEELERAFRDSVDDYLEFCAQRGAEPDKPFSGKFVLRVPKELHRELFCRSVNRGVSLNTYITQELKKIAM